MTQIIPMRVVKIQGFHRDPLGPERIFQITERRETRKRRGFLVIDNSAMGRPCVGGTFMLDSIDPKEVRGLARNMTLKSALTELNESAIETPDGIKCIRWGGSKLGIVGSAHERRNKFLKAAIIRGVVQALFDADVIPQLHLFDLDRNINEEDSALVAKQLKSNKVAAGLPRRLGGIPSNALGITGFGVVEGGQALAEMAGVQLENSTHVIQGFGAVGQAIFKNVIKKGANVIAVSDIDGGIYNPNGLDRKELFRVQKETPSILNYSLQHEVIAPGEELFLPTTFIWYAAKEDILTQPEQLRKIKAKFHIEGANLPISTECQKLLILKGCYMGLDIALNTGGIIASWIEQRFLDQLDTEHKIAMAFRETSYSARTVTQKITEEALKTKRAPREVAIEMAKERIARAQNFQP